MTLSPTTEHATATNPAPTGGASAPSWESNIAELLSGLSETQGELLKVLGEKRDALMSSDTEKMEAIQSREQALIERLQACQQRRTELLGQAEQEGLPSASIVELASALESEGDENSSGDSARINLAPQLAEAQSRSRILSHQALTNWVLVQRTLLHLSQLLEIIATGGRPEPTYGKANHSVNNGSLVDHAI